MWYDRLLEKDLIPDSLIRRGIRKNCRQRLKEETLSDPGLQQEKLMDLVRLLKGKPIAEETASANTQHYEVPTQFFQLVLGKRLKYSCAWWDSKTTGLDQAELDMLELTTERARLHDGHRILECGCGWGSLSLYMASKYPNSHITAVSNSRTQKAFIDAQAMERGLTNLMVITADMNHFITPEKFDRIVSVEMFEHMRNYKSLMHKLSSFLHDDGKLFVHIFTHRELSYLYEVIDETDWMSKHFFSGGVMPSDHLLLYFADDFKISHHWHVNGLHYTKTSEAWLANMDRHKKDILALFEETYGREHALKWWVYWRIFFMACAELWKFNEGKEWMVSHYLFENRPVHTDKPEVKQEMKEAWHQ